MVVRGGISITVGLKTLEMDEETAMSITWSSFFRRSTQQESGRGGKKLGWTTEGFVTEGFNDCELEEQGQGLCSYPGDTYIYIHSRVETPRC